jgi:Mg-chelatase subunit ChlD
MPAGRLRDALLLTLVATLLGLAAGWAGARRARAAVSRAPEQTSPCRASGQVSLSTKYVCPFEPVEVLLHVEAACPEGTGVRAVRLTNELGHAIVGYDGQTGRTEPDSTRTWTFDHAPAGGITVTHWVRPTGPGRHQIGAGAQVELEDDGGLRASGRLRPATLTVLAPCDAPYGTAVFLPLASRPLCNPLPEPADIALLLDRSASIGPEGLAQAGRQVDAFLAGLDLERDRVALLAFDQTVSLLAPLGSDAAAIHAALARIRPAPGTRLERAIRAGVDVLDGAAERAGRRRVLVLVTDGVQTGLDGEAAVRAAADGARAGGVAILSLAVGPGADHRLLGAVAGDPERVVAAPGGAGLESAFREVAVRVGCVR